MNELAAVVLAVSSPADETASFQPVDRDGGGGRLDVDGLRDAILRAARAAWAAQPSLREHYRTYRPNVERVISQVASRGGRRLKLRYRGTTRNNAWLKRRTAALNLRTLLSRGLASTNGTWVLA